MTVAKRASSSWTAAAILSAALTPRAQDAVGASAGRYGFAGHEIYKFAHGIHGLASGDLDGDGRADLALANDARSRLEILRRLPDDAPDDPLAEREPDGQDTGNPLRYDGRFEVRRWPVERRVHELAIGDFDRDGRAELCYATEGGELVLLDALEGAEPRVRRRRIDELRTGCELLAAADVDGDGAAEILAASDDTLLRLSAGPDGLGAPELLERVEPGLSAVHLADVDGDGARDLVCVYLDEDYPVRVRRGLGGARFGPRFDPELPQLRGAALADLDRDGASEILAVFELSGRLAVLGPDLARSGEAMLARTGLEQVGKDPKRGFAVGDLSGDGAAEIVVAEPDAARVVVHAATRGARALEARAFPSLVGATHPRVGDLDGDGRAELVVASAPERLIGRATLDADGRLPFPDALPVEGEPGALEVHDLDGDGRAEICAVASAGEGRNRTSTLLIWRGSPAGPVAPPLSTPIEGLSKQPSALRAADLDRDGRPDLVLFLPGESEVPLLFVQRADGTFAGTSGAARKAENAPGMGVLAGAGPERLFAGDVDGDGRGEVVVAAKNFARVQHFPRAAQGVFEPEVALQVNGPAPDSRIAAAVALDWNGDGQSELALRDERTREVLVYERASGAEPREIARFDAGRIDFRALVPADVDGDGRTDLVVLGAGELGVCYAGAGGLALAERAAYESPRARVYLDQVAAADLDADGTLEVVASEVSENSLVILSYGGRSLRHGLGFRVFESHAFEREDSEREPRELVAADVSGDRRTDLCVLVHDKLIVYLQE